MKIEVLVGMIASGKSTYARKRADEGALVISHDDLTAMLHAQYRYEEGLRGPYRAMEEALAQIGLGSVCGQFPRGRDVVIDRTHLTRESRLRWLRFARDVPQYLCARVVAVAFPVEPSVVHARRRFESDPRGRTFEDWLKVADHHHDQFMAEPLGDSEGFAEILRGGFRP